MTEGTRYTIDDAPEPPAPEEGPSAEESAETASSAVGDAAEGAAAAAPGPRDAWRDVLTQIDALADSMGRWTKAAIDDPENRRHASEIKARFDTVGAKLGSAVDEAAKSEIGQSVQQAAEKTGQAVVGVGSAVAQEAAPVVTSALSGLADLFGKAAEHVGKAADSRSAEPVSAAEETPAEETPAETANDEEPVAPPEQDEAGE